jgi:hypothetical protein
MSYLDELKRHNLELIEAFGAARTAKERAGELVRLLAPQRREIARKSVLERAQLRNKALKEEQRGREVAGPGAPTGGEGLPPLAEDDDLVSMAPPEVRATGMKGLGPAWGGVDALKEVFGGGGPQPAAQGGGVPGAGERVRTETVTAPANRTITGTGFELFQTNVATFAAALDSGDARTIAEQFRALGSTYGAPYAMQVARLAKGAQQAAMATRLRQAPAMARALMGVYDDLDYQTALAVTQAEARGDFEEAERRLQGKALLSREKAQAEIAASQALVRQRNAAAVESKERALTLRAERGEINARLNAEHLDETLLGFSTANALTAKYGGESGQVTPKAAFQAMGDVLDEDGLLKKSEALTAKALQDWWVRGGGLLVFGADKGWVDKRISAFWADENNNTVVGIGQVVDMVRTEDTEALEALNLGKLEGGKFIWAYQEDPMHRNANPSRAVHNYIVRAQKLGAEFPLETRRGAAQMAQEGVGEAPPEPAPEPTTVTPTGPMEPPAALGQRDVLQGPLGQSLKGLAQRWWAHQAEQTRRQHEAMEELRRRTGRP